MEDREENKPKELKAKDVSLWGKIVGGLVILIGHILMWLNILPNARSSEICSCGMTIMGVFSTVDLNIMVDKFTKRA